MWGSGGMVRKAISCAIMLALFIGGMVVLGAGLEVWLDGKGGFVAPMRIGGGAICAAAWTRMLAEDFAEAFLQPKALPPPDQRAG